MAPIPLPHLKAPMMNDPKVPFDTWTLSMSEVWLFKAVAEMAAQDIPAAKKPRKTGEVDMEDADDEDQDEGQSPPSDLDE